MKTGTRTLRSWNSLQSLSGKYIESPDACGQVTYSDSWDTLLRTPSESLPGLPLLSTCLKAGKNGGIHSQYSKNITMHLSYKVIGFIMIFVHVQSTTS